VEKWRSGEVEKWRSGEVEKWKTARCVVGRADISTSPLLYFTTWWMGGRFHTF